MYVRMGVCMSGYAFRHASRYRAESWHGGRGHAHEVCGHIFEATPPGVKGHPGVNLLSKALWLPNLVGRTPDQSVMHCWSQRSCRGQSGVKLRRNALWPPSWGQVGVNLLRSALWSSNLMGRIPDQSVMHCWGQRSCRGQPGSTRGQIA